MIYRIILNHEVATEKSPTLNVIFLVVLTTKNITPRVKDVSCHIPMVGHDFYSLIVYRFIFPVFVKSSN